MANGFQFSRPEGRQASRLSGRALAAACRRRVQVLLACLLVALALPAAADQIKLDSMKVGTRSYTKVTVLGFNATDVYFTHSRGISNAKLRQLDADLQKLFHYDAAAASEAERQQVLDNEEFNKQVAQKVEEDAVHEKEAARRRAMSFEQNVADPLSDRCPIGRPVPELKVEKWIGGKPETREHWQLIYLWAPWSQASKKFMPDMNTLQGKFPKEVTFFGLVSEASGDPETEAGVKAEFPTGIDSTEEFIKALDVTSVPTVVLADPKGVVRYLGHPAALTDKRLQELLGKFSQ
jgi:hypothetical protein